MPVWHTTPTQRASWQAPSRQTSPAAQGPDGQTKGSQLPPAHFSPAGQVTPTQLCCVQAVSKHTSD